MLYYSTKVKDFKLNNVIDNYNCQTYMPVSVFQIIHYQDSRKALDYLKTHIDSYMDYDQWKFTYKMSPIYIQNLKYDSSPDKSFPLNKFETLSDYDIDNDRELKESPSNKMSSYYKYKFISLSHNKNVQNDIINDRFYSPNARPKFKYDKKTGKTDIKNSIKFSIFGQPSNIYIDDMKINDKKVITSESRATTSRSSRKFNYLPSQINLNTITHSKNNSITNPYTNFNYTYSTDKNILGNTISSFKSSLCENDNINTSPNNSLKSRPNKNNKPLIVPTYAEYLSEIEKNIYPQSWSYTKLLCKTFLENSVNNDDSSELINYIMSSKPMIEKLKIEYGLSNKEISNLQSISYNPSNALLNLKKISNDIEIYDWSFRKDYDRELLKDRITFCKSIHKKLNERLRNKIVSSRIVREDDFIFADVKNYERSLIKLEEKFKLTKLQNSGLTKNLRLGGISSSCYMIKDLLRGSVICDTFKQVKKVIDMFKKSEFEIIEFKNGYIDKKDKDGEIIYKFERTNYADIKLILRTPSNLFYYDELIEIQIIQRINLDLKKIEHKIYDFKREKDHYIKISLDNQSLIKSLNEMNDEFSISSAENISYSRLNQQDSIKECLMKYFPYNYHQSLSKDNYFLYIESFNYDKFNIIYKQLKLIKPIKDYIHNIKIEYVNNKFKLKFDFKSNLNLKNKQISLKYSGYDEDIEDIRKDIESHGIELPQNKFHMEGLRYEQETLYSLYRKTLQKLGISSFNLSLCGNFIFASDERGDYYKLDRYSFKTLKIYETSSINYDSINTRNTVPDDFDYKDAITYNIILNKDESKMFTIIYWDYYMSHCNVCSWDVNKAEKLYLFRGHTSKIYKLILSEDDQTLYTCSKDQTIISWCARNGEIKYVFEGHKDRVYNIILKKDNLFLFSASMDNTIKSWDTQQGICIHTFYHHESNLRSQNNLLISLDGKILFSGGIDHTIKAWDTSNGSILKNIRGHTDTARHIILSNDGIRMFTSGNHTDLIIRTWNIYSGDCTARFQGHTEEILIIVLSFDGRTLFSSSTDKTIREWSTYSGECTRVYVGHSSSIDLLRLTNDGRTLFSCDCKDSTMHSWTTESGDITTSYEGHKKSVQCIIKSKYTDTLYSYSHDSDIRIWSINQSKSLKTLHGQLKRNRKYNKSSYSQTTINIIKMNKNEDIIYCIGYDRDDQVINAWNVTKGKWKLLKSYRGKGIREVKKIDISKDETIMYIFGYGIVSFYDLIFGYCKNIVHEGVEYFKICNQMNYMYILELYKPKNYVILKYDIQGKKILDFSKYIDIITHMIISDDSSIIYTSSQDSYIRGWNNMGQLINEFKTNSIVQRFEMINASEMYTLDDNNEIRKYSVDKKRCTLILHQHALNYFIDYKYDFIYVTEKDKIFKVIDIYTGRQIKKYKGIYGINYVEFDKEDLYACSENSKIYTLKRCI